MSISTISPRQLHDMVQAHAEVELIDVRTPVEFQEVHVSFARNVPLDKLGSSTSVAGHSGAAQPLYVICRSGSRGKQACEKLVAAGYSNVVNVEGGTQAWAQAALPVVRGEKAFYRLSELIAWHDAEERRGPLHELRVDGVVLGHVRHRRRFVEREALGNAAHVELL
jgi:rhodanese-related sulfurtransferase